MNRLAFQSIISLIFDWIYPENRPINAVLLKYTNNGQLLRGRAVKSDIAIEIHGMTIDDEDNIILSFLSYGGYLYFDSTIIISDNIVGLRPTLLKINSKGDLVNQMFFKSSKSKFKNQGGVAHDKFGNIYFTSRTEGNIINLHGDTILRVDLNRGRYLLLFKLDKEFNVVWLKKYYNVDGYFGDVKVDNEDNVIVYGMFRGRELTVDSLTVKNA